MTISQVYELLKNNKYKIIGVTGNSGAGKTSMSNTISKEVGANVYSIDYRFIGDTNYRKGLLKSKQENSINAYIDACNQYSWWNWDLVYKDLTSFVTDSMIDMYNVYNRSTGIFGSDILITGDKLIVEGAILGPSNIVNILDVIMFIYTPINKRFNRLLDKDKGRRSFQEIMSRFLITEYSEAMYYKFLIDNYRDKIIVYSDDFITISDSVIIPENQYIPLKVDL